MKSYNSMKKYGNKHRGYGGAPDNGGLEVKFPIFVCLFHLYPPVTRKRRLLYILDEYAPA